MKFESHGLFKVVGKYLGGFLVGSLILCLFSTVQKLYFGVPLTLNLYIVPVFFGGTVGLILLLVFERYSLASKKFQELFLQSDQAIVLTNAREIVITANPQALRFFETTKSEFIGSNLLDRCPNHHDCKNLNTKFEIEFTKKSGKKIQIDVSTRKILTTSGFMHQRIFRDLTEQKFLEAKKNIENQLESISFMAQGLSHDFFNLITIIKNNIALIMDDLYSPTKGLTQMEDNLKDCIGACERAEKLVQSLQSLSSQKKPEKTLGSLHNLISQSVSFALKTSDIIVDVALDPDFPELPFDPDQISQVLINLLLNAKESMDNEGRINIKTEILDLSHRVNLAYERFGKISIQDQGCGIPPENLKKIFHPYFTTKKMGHGLGLATCQKIVQDHEGFIIIDSKINEGTTISVFLPLITTC